MSFLKATTQIKKGEPIIFLIDKNTDWSTTNAPDNEKKLVLQKVKKKVNIIPFNTTSGTKIYVSLPDEKNLIDFAEQVRGLGSNVTEYCNNQKISTISVANASTNQHTIFWFLEGMALANYQFLKYKKDVKKLENSLKTINISKKYADSKKIKTLNNVVAAVFEARNLVNEPLSYLTAPQMSKEIQRLGKEKGFDVEVLGMEKIKALKMGGLLAVNYGSVDPPRFNILEWKPKKPNNKKPIILVGKGVVYDTGGLSLKPTANSMDHMKCDMGGAAAVIGAFCAAADNNLPVHIIGLIPATDNRPGKNAYAPGDVITMYNKMTVEVLNTDAEGRMLLADALAYAQQYKPELVIDLATLTGAALRALGQQAMAMMSTADENTKTKLKESGFRVHERMVEMPLWKEYGDMLKSDIADIKNIGGPFAGAITAGKFLEHFTDYPWVHLDIAPLAWGYEPSSYRLRNGTGAGVRVLYDFLKTV